MLQPHHRYECTAVNQEALTPSVDLNVVIQIKVRAVGNRNVCWHIQVDLDMCKGNR